MKLLKKVSIGVTGVLVTVIGTMIFMNNSSVKATDEVTIQAFNDLKAEVETLKEKVNLLETDNKNLKTTLETTNSEVTTTKNNINTVKSDLTKNINENSTKISKIEVREDYFYTQMKNFRCGAAGCGNYMPNTVEYILTNLK